MKKKIILTVSAMFILILGIVAFAVNQSSNSSKMTADSCAMKNMTAQTADGQAKTSCCDKDSCCCKGDSCPMKTQGENASANCCACCGDSCPMKNKETQTTGVDMKNATVVSGESCCQKGASCCNGGACCKGKQG